MGVKIWIEVEGYHSSSAVSVTILDRLNQIA